MCRSNQVNEIAEENSSSEEGCNLIHSFDSCEEFEIMVVEPRLHDSPGKIGKIISGVKDNHVIQRMFEKLAFGEIQNHTK